MSDVDVPPYSDMLLPVLRAVIELGGSASIPEIVETTIKREGYTEEQQGVLHNAGPETKIVYRLGWARTYLKRMGLLTNSDRGVWSLTDEGSQLVADQAMTPDEKRQKVHDLWAAVVADRRSSRRNRGKSVDVDAAASEDEPDHQDSPGWREELLETLMSMSPDAFERLAKRLLREADFASVTVTGKSGDGGIDGLGVYQLGLVSFPVFFQCKRYRGSVGSGAVRDFRGAMAGRGDKGLLITTGTFTSDAKREANRDGAPAIDLIDGERLCGLLKRYELGVRTTIRQVEDISVEPEFFAEV